MRCTRQGARWSRGAGRDAGARDASDVDGMGAFDAATEDGGSEVDGGSDTDSPDASTEDVGTSDAGTSSGLSCRHTTGGGLYGDTACSESYQCCDGIWRPRDPGCGACRCVETTGTLGCGDDTPPSDDPYDGLTRAGSEIPRRGLRNATGGVGTELHGEVVTADGHSWVRGTISQFGGPSDTGVTPTETGAITGERLRSLNDPLDASRSVIDSRPEDFYYAAMRFSYSPGGTSFWRDVRLLIRNPTTGRRVVVRPVDWGPHIRTGRIIDVAPQTELDLGVRTDDLVDVAFALPGTPLGPVD